MTRTRSFIFLVAVVALAAALAVGIHAQAPQAAAPTKAQQPAQSQSPVAAPPPAAQGPPPQPSHDKPAEAVYHNIKVLTGVPSDQVVESMDFFRASLGVECDFCHVRKDNHLQPELDDKKEKQTAREMITMMKSINDANFKGQQEVNCATCHHGSHQPVATPPLATAEEVRARFGPDAIPEIKRADLPKADDLFDKYEQAIGGREAIEKLTTREARGTVTPTIGNPFPSETYQKAPNKAVLIQTRQQGKAATGFDGTTAWRQFGPRAQALDGPDAETLKVAADFFRDLKFKGRYTRSATVGKEKVNGHDAWVVRGILPNNKFSERLYLDAQSGLLLRRTTLTRTPFGALAETSDFDDYRDVNGVKVPFVLKQSTASSVVTRKLDQVSFNTPIDDSKFAMPAPAPQPAPQP